MNKVHTEMTSRVVFAKETDDLQQVHQSMRALGVRHVPVTRDGIAVGILSDRDVLRHAQPGKEGHIKVPAKSVQEVMTRELIVCHEEDSLSACADSMLKHQISCLPVVDSKGKLVGILTTTDLLRLIRDRYWEPDKKLPFRWETIPLLHWRETAHAI